MSEYQRKFEAAETELDKAGIWPSNAVPPYIWFLRKLGLTPIPPHYRSLKHNFLDQTVFFTLLMGLVSFSMVGGPDGRTITEFAVRTVAIGFVLGVIMVSYYALSRRKYALSRWEDL